MEDFRFVKFKVYADAKIFVKEIFGATSHFVAKFGYLSNQLNRAALSVVLNIAEGSGKKSDKDFNRYIQNALGSVHELYAALDVAKDLQLISEADFKKLTTLLSELRKQLGGLTKKLTAES
jgi:four helix bundle protein